VSEFFADELALILNCSRAAATKLADSAVLLTERLPSTWAALADGQLDWPRARALAAELIDPARDAAPHVLAEVEAAVLPRAHELSIPRLQAAVRTELLPCGPPSHGPNSNGWYATAALSTRASPAMFGPGPTTACRSVRPHPGATPVRQHPGPHLPPSRLQERRRLGRPRPRHPARGRRPDRLREPVLSVAGTTGSRSMHPAGDSSGPRWRSHGDHTRRGDPHHPPTRSAPPPGWSLSPPDDDPPPF
jgi:hypothetical protein